jgi:ribonucleoside-diphosphate reductase alpha chain
LGLGFFKKEVMEHGVRNSLLVAPMPTASTSQILGNNEAFDIPLIFIHEEYFQEIHCGKQTFAARFSGTWALERDHEARLMRNNGSVQDLDIPQDLKELYKTVWEMSMKDIIDMSRRGYFVDQSQSLNLFMQNANYIN